MRHVTWKYNKIDSNLNIKNKSGVDPLTKKYKVINVSDKQSKKDIKEVFVPNFNNVDSKDIDSSVRDKIFE